MHRDVECQRSSVRVPFFGLRGFFFLEDYRSIGWNPGYVVVQTITMAI